MVICMHNNNAAWQPVGEHDSHPDPKMPGGPLKGAGAFLPILVLLSLLHSWELALACLIASISFVVLVVALAHRSTRVSWISGVVLLASLAVGSALLF